MDTTDFDDFGDAMLLREESPDRITRAKIGENTTGISNIATLFSYCTDTVPGKISNLRADVLPYLLEIVNCSK